MSLTLYWQLLVYNRYHLNFNLAPFFCDEPLGVPFDYVMVECTDLKTNWITHLARITEANGGHIGSTHLM